MKPTINISVSKPCSETFSQFKTTPSGGFCKACQKEVIDFRSMSDQQLIDFFKNREANTCGYFKASQLKDYPEPIQYNKTNTNKYLRAVGFALFSMVSLHNIQAQVQETKFEIVEQNHNTKKDQDKTIGAQQQLLTGTVSDETAPLPGANIVLKNTTIGTSTNFDGEFEFPRPLQKGDF
ncbi:carboxypeptidase-like regulatory domain-containing protein [Aestuariivivens insulae]|uniref:carboxypeptidase-like regulatory domain-containing protein n=1 Tax=Aestuariivivens insulae TaxID=1621988 RepID=UPI001F581043|nr:carboxypeptidase-like regulatory domain-containing protein [Aestuariivivens insulae]